MSKDWDGEPPNAGDGAYHWLRTRYGRRTPARWEPRPDGGVWMVIGLKCEVYPIWMSQARWTYDQFIEPTKDLTDPQSKEKVG